MKKRKDSEAHQGRMHRGDAMHLKSHSGMDPLAWEENHGHTECGLSQHHFHPEEEYDGDECDSHMGCNETHS